MKFVSIFAIIIILFGLQTLKGQNILINPSFEVWLDTLGINLPLGWITSEITFPGTATKSTDAHTGDFAIKLVGGDSIAYAATTTLVRAGNQYDFTGWSKCPSILGGSFVIAWLSLSFQSVGTPTLVPIYFSNNYREYTNSVTAPDSAVFVLVTAGALPQATIYVDDVTLDTVASGIKENQPAKIISDQIQISPNPFTRLTVIRVLSSKPAGTTFELDIYDLTGKLVKSFASNNHKLTTNNFLVWDGNDNFGRQLVAGIYFCRLLTSNNTSLTNKIVISR